MEETKILLISIIQCDEGDEDIPPSLAFSRASTSPIGRINVCPLVVVRYCVSRKKQI